MTTYAEFIQKKSQLGGMSGFEPTWLPDYLKPFQRYLVEWNTRMGRAACFADCGLGKGPIQLVCAENAVRHTNRPALIVTPLAVSHQMIREAEKFGVEAHRSTDGKPRPNITVTNYERLKLFDPDDYCFVSCDEASIVKHWTGATQKLVTRFLSKVPHRLLCTATPSPNDYVEMGTLSEALGGLTHSDMLATFFRQLSDDEKKKRATPEDITSSRKLSWRVIQSFGQWALRSHAFEPFWKWVASWSRACRKPSDLGDYDDSEFTLPELARHDHTVTPRKPPPGWLYTMPAFGLSQERQERLRTLDERTELVADLVKDHDRSMIWCHLNPEGDILERMIPNALQVAGRHDDDYKETVIGWFLGHNCLCKDKRFSAKLASWQRAKLDGGIATINHIIDKATPGADTCQQHQSSGESTNASTITNTSGCGSERRSKPKGGTGREGSGTPPTPGSGRNSGNRSRSTAPPTRKSGSRTNCESGESPSKSTAPQPPPDVPSAADPTATTGASTDSTPTTATAPGHSEGSSARLVILDSESSAMIQSVLKEPQCICGHQSGVRRLISKPKVCGLGLNLQHCAHVVTFVTHSYEQFRQCVGRCHRFGQTRPVTLDVIATEGEVNVRKNMDRKERLSEQMFDSVVRFMNDAVSVNADRRTLPVEVPSWLR